MIALLGSPQMPLTTQDQPERASPQVKKLETYRQIEKVAANGLGPAVDSLAAVLTRAFAGVPGLKAALRGDGMLAVRLRRPTSGRPSTKISNHSWGAAIDLKLDGFDPPGATGDKVPYFIAALVPFFNEAGWYSGIGFSDDMHFEVSDETLREWARDGKLGASLLVDLLAGAPLGRAGLADHLLVAPLRDRELEEAAKYKPFVMGAATSFGVDPLLLYAVGSRESDWGLTLRPPGPAGTGDWAPRNPARFGYSMPPDGLGWGRGLLQADYGQAFGQTGDWRDPKANIEHGAQELAAGITYFKKLGYPNVDPVRAGVAADSCGRGGGTRSLEAGFDVDYKAAGRNYSADVLHRRARFQPLVT